MKLRIESAAVVGAKTSFELDGQDFSNAVRGTDIRMRVGDLLDVRVDVVVRDGLSFEGDVRRIDVPPETVDLLRHIGWLPPLTELGAMRPEVADRLRELHDEYRSLLEGVPIELAGRSRQVA